MFLLICVFHHGPAVPLVQHAQSAGSISIQNRFFKRAAQKVIVKRQSRQHVGDPTAPVMCMAGQTD